MHIDLLINADQPADLFGRLELKIREVHLFIALQAKLAAANMGTFIHHFHSLSSPCQFNVNKPFHYAGFMKFIQRNEIYPKIGIGLRLHHLTEISGNEFVMAIKSFNVDRQAAVYKNELLLLRIIDTPQGVYFQVLLDITGKLVDV